MKPTTRRTVSLTLVFALAGLGAACSSDASTSGASGADTTTTTTTPTGGSTSGASASTGATTGSTGPSIVLPVGSEPVSLDPDAFVLTVDNPFWPLSPGSRWVYRETSGDGEVFRVVVTVTSQTKQILGIDATVVHDVVSSGHELVEDTFDWYAQDVNGNVWYLGEDTKEFKHGEVVSTEGSWEAGVDGAQPGVILPANPTPGLTYREEYLEGQAEDAATVLGVDERVQVPFGTFKGVLFTKNYTPLQPNLVEHKFYAAGVGQVMAITVSGGSDREELLSYRPG